MRLWSVVGPAKYRPTEYWHASAAASWPWRHVDDAWHHCGTPWLRYVDARCQVD